MSPDASFLLPGNALGLSKTLHVFAVRLYGEKHRITVQQHALVDKLLVPCPEVGEETVILVDLYDIGFHVNHPVSLLYNFEKMFLRPAAPGLLSYFRGVNADKTSAMASSVYNERHRISIIDVRYPRFHERRICTCLLDAEEWERNDETEKNGGEGTPWRVGKRNTHSLLLGGCPSRAAAERPRLFFTHNSFFFTAVNIEETR